MFWECLGNLPCLFRTDLFVVSLCYFWNVRVFLGLWTLSNREPKWVFASEFIPLSRVSLGIIEFPRAHKGSVKVLNIVKHTFAAVGALIMKTGCYLSDSAHSAQTDSTRGRSLWSYSSVKVVISEWMSHVTHVGRHTHDGVLNGEHLF